MRAMCARLRVQLAAPRHVLSPFVKNMTPELLSRETSKARSVTLQARSQTSIQAMALGPLLKLFSFHRHVNQMPHSWYHAKAFCVMWLRGEATQICVSVLEWYTRP